MAAEFDRSRTYGVEIENCGTYEQMREVATLLTSRGLTTHLQGYNHLTQSYWKIVSDSSCGYELVSPILRGDDGLRQIKMVCDAVNEVGVKVNRKCGLHVHHGASDLSVQHFRNLYCLYIRYEDTIDSMMPVSRRENNNHYCKSMKVAHMISGSTVDKTVEAIRKARTISDLDALYGTRYVKLNVQSYVRHGTIEFRQHSGTTDFDKIENWVKFTSAMIVKAKTSNVRTRRVDSQDTWAGLKAMMNMLASKGATQEMVGVSKFYTKRIKQLAAA